MGQVTNLPSSGQVGNLPHYDCLRVLLALLLLAAAVLKGHQLATSPVVGNGWLDARWVLIATVEFELLFGLWLLSGLLPRVTWLAACACFALFACVSLYKALSGATTCGCFGRVEVNPWYTFALDIAAVLALLRFPPQHPVLPSPLTLLPSPLWPLPSRSSRLRLAAVLALFLLLGLPAGLTMATYRAATLDDAGEFLGDGRIVVLEPEKWIGKRFPLLPYIDIGDQLAEGTSVVMLYHENCPVCRRWIEEYRKLASQVDGRSDLDCLGFVELAPYRTDVDKLPRHGTRTARYGRLRADKEWFLAGPVVIELRDGTVTAVSRNGLSDVVLRRVRDGVLFGARD